MPDRPCPNPDGCGHYPCVGVTSHTHLPCQPDVITHKDEFGTALVRKCSCGWIQRREITHDAGFKVRDSEWFNPHAESERCA